MIHYEFIGSMLIMFELGHDVYTCNNSEWPFAVRTPLIKTAYEISYHLGAKSCKNCHSGSIFKIKDYSSQGMRCYKSIMIRYGRNRSISPEWRHNGRDGVSNHQPHQCLLNYSNMYSGAGQRKHQNVASLAFVRGIHRWPVNSPHKWPVTWKMFPFDDVIMLPSMVIVMHVLHE